jgi:hypothetical protein
VEGGDLCNIAKGAGERGGGDKVECATTLFRDIVIVPIINHVYSTQLQCATISPLTIKEEAKLVPMI